LLSIPDLDLLQADPRFHFFADPARRHRIGIVFHPDGAATPHAHPLALQRLQASFRQRPQVHHLGCDFRRPAGIALPQHAQDERPVLLAAGKISAAAQQQRLLHRLLEVTM
jgi:hypothetical protein